MLLLAAALVAGDAWTWSVAVRYDDPVEGLLLDDRERWTVRVGKRGEISAERTFVGTVVADGTFVPGSDARVEVRKGRIAADGTLHLDRTWSDEATGSILMRLLNPIKGAERLGDWPFARKGSFRQTDAPVPGGDGVATLRVDVALVSARLGGREIVAERRP